MPKSCTITKNGIEGKNCKVCGWNPFTKFTKDGFRKDGSQKYRVLCNSCRSQKRKEVRSIKTKEKNKIIEKQEKEFLKNYVLPPKKEKRKTERVTYLDENKDIIIGTKHKIVDEVELKFCKQCSEWLLLNKFYKDKNKKDNLRSLCKICTNKSAKISFNYNKCEKHKKSKYLCKECYPNKHREHYDKLKTKRETNENYRIKENLRHRVWGAIKNNSKSSTTTTLIGCTITELWNHLESQFTEGMTRDNYGKWHCDHIIPCDAFDLSRPEEQRRCFNYRNLQPMWGSENSSKGNEYKFNIILEIELLINSSPTNN